jgi:CDP-diacylglycerol--glycerol-3-phosphate 3-phosphatidyltransferase
MRAPASQMTSLALLLCVKDGGSGALAEAAGGAGAALLLVASWLTMYSLWVYVKGLWRFMARA